MVGLPVFQGNPFDTVLVRIHAIHNLPVWNVIEFLHMLRLQNQQLPLGVSAIYRGTVLFTE